MTEKRWFVFQILRTAGCTVHSPALRVCAFGNAAVFSFHLMSFFISCWFELTHCPSVCHCMSFHHFRLIMLKLKALKELNLYSMHYSMCTVSGVMRMAREVSAFCFENIAVFWERNWTFCSRNLHVWSLWNSVPVLQQPSGAHAVPRRWVSPEPPKTFKLLQIWTRSLFCLHGIFASARCWAFHAQMGEMWAPRINFSFFPSCALLISKWFSHLYSLFIHRPACHLHLHIFLECTADFNCPAFRPFRFLLSPARKTCRCQGIFKLCCPRLIKNRSQCNVFLLCSASKYFIGGSKNSHFIWTKSTRKKCVCVCFKCFCFTPLLSV